MATSGGAEGAVRLLVCRVGAKLCALPLEQLLETMRPLPTEALANLPDFVLGLALIRGRPTPVLDARRLLGSPHDRAPERYVTLDVSGGAARVVALAVDSVIGVRDLPAEALGDLPSLLRTPESDVVGTIATLDAELVLVLERGRLLPNELWQRLEPERSSP
jgi:purine-binding chemotaxis protein CheW